MTTRVMLYPIQPADYLRGEQLSDSRHELVNGEIFAMVGATAAHNLISGNIFGILHQHLKGQPCRSYISDMKVKVADNFYYPDVMVDCSPLADDALFCETPIVLIEVLSASTKAYDKTHKLQQYQQIATLQEYVMIEQDCVRIELVRRHEQWTPCWYGLGDQLTLQSIGLTLSVAEVYDRIQYG